MQRVIEDAPRVECDGEGAPQESERLLIARAATDPEALAELYRLHVDRISRYIARRTGRHPDAEDLVANVFLALVRHVGKHRATDRPLAAWLYRVATNEVNRWLRRRKVLQFFHLADVPRPAPDGDEAEHVRALLLRLPCKYQSVLTLHYLEQLPLAVVANILTISLGAAKTRLARGRELLRRELDRANRPAPDSPRPHQGT